MSKKIEYIGFWPRVIATLIDTVAVSAMAWIIYVLTTMLINGLLWELLVPLMLTLAFWIKVGATPGKMLVNAEIVDEETKGKPSPLQFLIRYLCYYLSALPFCLGFLWAVWDPKKQCWHDKIARTAVIRSSRGNIEIQKARKRFKHLLKH